MSTKKTLLKDSYFKLRYIEKLIGYKEAAIYLNKNEHELKSQYAAKGGLDQLFVDILSEKLHESVNIKDLGLLRTEEPFKTYHQVYANYYNKDREELFANPDKLVKWFTEQKQTCGYCGITQDELLEIVALRGGRLTLNKKQKRSGGKLEIERIDPSSPYIYKNCILACPLCNNAKSNLIDEASWRELFAEPMRKYYQKLLKKPLKNN